MKGLVYLGPQTYGVSGNAGRRASASTMSWCESRHAAFAAPTCTATRGITGRRTPPMIMGHEFGGVIEKLGSRVTGFQIGRARAGDAVRGLRRLRLLPDRPAGDVRRASRARRRLTERRDGRAGRRPGGLARADSARSQLRPGHDGRAANRGLPRLPSPAGASHGRTWALIGVGTIGLLALQIVRLAGPRRIFVSDLIPEKLTRAERYGATDTINAGADVVGHIMGATGGARRRPGYRSSGL